MTSVFVTEPIDKGDPESGFACGEPPLDAFFAKHALPNDRRGLGRTFVLRRGHGDHGDLPPILGFYTLSMADLEATRVPAELGAGLPRYPVPVALVGQVGQLLGAGIGEGGFDAHGRYRRSEGMVSIRSGRLCVNACGMSYRFPSSVESRAADARPCGDSSAWTMSASDTWALPGAKRPGRACNADDEWTETPGS